MLAETWLVTIILIFTTVALCVCSFGWMHEEKNSIYLSKKLRKANEVIDFQEKHIQKLQSEISILKLNLEEKKK